MPHPRGCGQNGQKDVDQSLLQNGFAAPRRGGDDQRDMNPVQKEQKAAGAATQIDEFFAFTFHSHGSYKPQLRDHFAKQRLGALPPKF
jgi:hypothetical protein